MFQKKTGLEGDHIPKDYYELKAEIRRWNRIGMPVFRQDGKIDHSATEKKDLNLTKTGFERKADFDHFYKDIEKDIERLIEEGHLLEFEDDWLHKSFKNDMTKQKRDVKTLHSKNESEDNQKSHARDKNKL